MISGGLLDDILSPEDRVKAQELATSKDGNFIKLIEMAGLDKRSDLRHTDLSGVDFSDCDLRGFDFTGADLRGAIGRDVQWDESTIFTNADVDRSPFAHELRKQEILNRLPELSREYARVKRAYWNEQAIWVMDTLRSDIRNREERQTLAMALYFDTKDPVVRNTVLTYLVLAADTRSERIDFLCRIIFDVSTPLAPAESAIRMYGSLLKSDASALPLLLTIAESDKWHPQLRNAAIRGVFQNQYVLRYGRRILNLVQDLSVVEYENLYLRAFAKNIDLAHQLVVCEGMDFGGLSLSEEINLNRLQLVCRRLWAIRMVGHQKSWMSRTITHLKSREDVAPFVVQILRDLVDRGVELNIDLPCFDPAQGSDEQAPWRDDFLHFGDED